MTIFLIQGVLIRVFSFFDYMYFDIYKHVVSTLDQIYTPIFLGSKSRGLRVLHVYIQSRD